jgi:hypothetical protein
MATAAGKKLRKKDLRQPDWFQTTSENAMDYLSGHRGLVVATLAVVLLLGLAVWGWQSFKERQNVAASAEFSRAMALYQSEKYREAIDAFDKVKDYRWSHYAMLAHLYLANSYLATGDIEKAVNEAQRSLVATRPESLYRQIALVTLATAEEQKKDWKAALEHYSAAQKIPGALQSRALLGKARSAEQLGDINTALAAYKEYVKDIPASPFTLKIAELEAKKTTAPAAH